MKNAEEAGSHPPVRYAFGTFILDPAQQRVLRSDGTALALSPRLFSALLLLAESAGQLLHKDSLMAALWPGMVVEENNLNQVVHSLRRALGDDAHGSRFIETVPRRGFRFVAAVTVLPAEDRASEQSPFDAGNASASLAGSTAAAATSIPEASAPAARTPPIAARPRRRHWYAAAALACGATVAVAIVLALTLSSRNAPPSLDAELANQRSIAVMPFTDLSSPKAPHAAYAVEDELTMGLGRLHNTRVISRESSAALGSSEVLDPKRVGRELGVAHVLAGAVRQDAERLSVTVRLLRTDTGALLWSDRFDYSSVADWAAQQNILARVANQLDLKVQQSVLERAVLSPPSSTAVDHWMRGTYLIMTGVESRERLALARGHFEAALAAQPDSGPALAGLGFTHAREVRKRWSKEPMHSLALAKELGRRALALNPDDQMALGMLGAAQNFAGEMEESIITTRRLIQLNPNSTAAHRELAISFYFLGRWEETLRQVDVAERLNPLDVASMGGLHDIAATTLVAMHRYDEAIERARRGAATNPANLVPFIVLTSAEAHRGHMDAARQHAAEILQREPGYWVGRDRPSRGSRAPAYAAAMDHLAEGLKLAGLPTAPPSGASVPVAVSR